MGPEMPPAPQSTPIDEPSDRPDLTPAPDGPPPEVPQEHYRGLRWIFIGPQGLRAFWSVAIFVLLFLLFNIGLASAFAKMHLLGRSHGSLSTRSGFFGELASFLAVVASAGLLALIERRRILDYNLVGPNRLARFISGLATGFVGLSVLIAGLALGGWLHFGPVALTGSQIFTFAAIWAVVFLMVGFVEEGTMRCVLLYTLARGINFWWATGLVAAMCLSLILRVKGNGAWGVYAIALLGLVPCLMLHVRKAESAGFWQASWVTSTFFGFGHTGNNGENWIGIFAAAFIGFVFCVSVRVTGSAWWAIGCHASWDWGETYFYGTADSGMVAQGHYLTTSLTGPGLWSGGADGPEGSILVLPVVLLLLAVLLVVYRRRKPTAIHVPTADHAADQATAG